jgi:hypothetical protein
MRRAWVVVLAVVLSASSAWAIGLLDATKPKNSDLISTYGANSRETRTTVNEIIATLPFDFQNFALKTADYTALPGDKLIVDTNSTSITITLPKTPDVGDFVVMYDKRGTWNTHNLVVDGNGTNIQGSASDYTATTRNSGPGIVAVYTEAVYGWSITTLGVPPGTVTQFKLSDYATLAAAIASISASPGVLLLDADNNVTANTATPSTLQVSCVNGYKTSIGAGKTLTINGTWDCPPTVHAFTGLGHVSLPTANEVYAEWFATNTVPGTTDMTDAILEQIRAVASGSSLKWLSKKYKIAGTGDELFLIEKNVNLLGSKAASISGQGTEFIIDETVPITTDIFHIKVLGECRGMMIRDFYITSSNYIWPMLTGAPGRHAIRVTADYNDGYSSGWAYNTIENVVIRATGGRSIYIDGGPGTTVNWISNCGLEKGIYYSGYDDIYIYNCAIQGPGYGIEATVCPGCFGPDIVGGDIISGGCVMIHSGITGYMDKTQCEPHYAFTDHSCDNATVCLKGDVGKIWGFRATNVGFSNTVCTSNPSYGCGYNGNNIVGLYVDNASETIVDGNFFGIPFPENIAIKTTSNALRTHLAPTNHTGTEDLFGVVRQVVGWTVHAGYVFERACPTELMSLLRDSTELVRASSLAAIADHEWWWESGILYTREDGATITDYGGGASYVDGYTHTGLYYESPYIVDDGLFTRGIRKGLRLQNGWTSDWANWPYVHSDISGIANVEGTVNGGTYTIGTTLFTFPVGFRPNTSLYFPAFSYEPTALAAETKTGTATGNLSGTLQVDNRTVISDSSGATIHMPITSYFTHYWRPVMLQALCNGCASAGEVQIADQVSGPISVMVLNGMTFTPYGR